MNDATDQPDVSVPLATSTGGASPEYEDVAARACDECGRTWEGKLPSTETVHVWLCPWCETRLSGRSVVWRQDPNDTWVIVLGQRHDDWPWNGPLRVRKEAH